MRAVSVQAAVEWPVMASEEAPLSAPENTVIDTFVLYDWI